MMIIEFIKHLHNLSRTIFEMNRANVFSILDK